MQIFESWPVRRNAVILALAVAFACTLGVAAIAMSQGVSSNVAASLALLTSVAFTLPAIAWFRLAKERRATAHRADQLAEDAQAEHQRMQAALANMPHGFCMFDADKCLVISNARYAEMYGLPPDLVRPGTPLQAIIDYRREIGNAPANFPNYVSHHGLEWKDEGNNLFEFALEDGRSIRINHLAMSKGGYVATHEDMTDAAIEASEARAARELAEARAAVVAELERKNKELEAFSYTVSHDLRAPLRAIDGFSCAILEDCKDQLDRTGQSHLRRIREAAKRMGELIDDILKLSRVTRAEMIMGRVDLSSLAHEIVDDLRRRDADHDADFVIGEGFVIEADRRLMRIVLENLLGNAWKFTRRTASPRIEFNVTEGDEAAFFVRDNGAGFDMNNAEKLFHPFQRLHSDAEFPGTGIGLATIHRVIDRHGGRVWAEGAVGRGACFYFTLPEAGLASLRFRAQPSTAEISLLRQVATPAAANDRPAVRN